MGTHHVRKKYLLLLSGCQHRDNCHQPWKIPRRECGRAVAAQGGRLLDLCRWMNHYLLMKFSPTHWSNCHLSWWVSTVNRVIWILCLVAEYTNWKQWNVRRGGWDFNVTLLFPQLDTQEMRFSSLTFDDSGMYQCIAENHHGVIYANAELRVFGESCFGRVVFKGHISSWLIGACEDIQREVQGHDMAELWMLSTSDFYQSISRPLSVFEGNDMLFFFF